MTEPPHDLTAERELLGWLMVKPTSLDAVRGTLAESDFYRPAHRALFGVLCDLRDQGVRVDNSSVITNEATKRGVQIDQGEYGDILAAGYPGVESTADLLVSLRVRREVIGISRAMATKARGPVDHDDLLDEFRQLVAGIDVPVKDGSRIGQLSTVTDFLDADCVTPAPWVIDGLMRADWRCMLVAAEGVGKSVATRQMALCAAQGIHPFRFTPIEPVRTLIVDLENPDDAIADTCRPILVTAQQNSVAYDPGRAWLWRQPQGINIRTRTGRGNLEAVISATQPDFVALGPVYKLYSVDRRESDEQATGECQRILDELRTRYSFAIILEHHAPKAQGGHRELLPFGSSLWLRWPELGLKLVTDKERSGSVTVGRFRHDRMPNAWPNRLDRGGTWPWSGYWARPETERGAA